ncbi:MAG: archaetidylserine decarboxylase [Lentisphaeria bacterium]|nr:archaetidylserine decarboxylase [Lentisphaeria bacterium]
MTQKSEDVFYIERGNTSPQREIIYGEKFIRWAYQDANSSWKDKLLFKSPLLSNLLGKYYDSKLSKGKIKGAIEQLKIDTNEFLDPVDSYQSFNQFFYRRLKPDARPYSQDKFDIISPGDGRIHVFPKLNDDTLIPIKGKNISMTELLEGEDGGLFKDGALAILRLCPADYHRYHFPYEGQITRQLEIPGAYHSVNPIAIALGIDVFCENKRSYTLIKNPDIGMYCFMEVAAFGVASMVETNQTKEIKRMDEKGYFEFGGSTIILIFQKDKIEFSEDLIANSGNGYETLLKVGETIAKVKGS